MKKLLSILLSMLMVLSFMPTSAFAEGEADLPVCVCETVCTVESMNTECPVCGDDGALPESCGQYIPAEDGQTDEPDNDPAEEDSDTVEQTSSEVAVTLTLLLPDGLSAEGMESVDEFTNKLMRTVGEDGKIAPVVLSCEDEGAFSAELAAALSETDAFKSSTLTAEYDETGDTLTISGAPAESAELDMNAILTVAMAAMGAYGAAPAEDDHTHCICGGENSVGDHTTHTNVTWTGISSLSEIAAEGNYYLKNDVTSGTWTCRIAGVKLCLNGKTITGTRDFVELINISAVASLAITDCQETVGKITNNGVEGSCIYNYGILTLWNGSITGSRRGVDNDNTFTMNGGSIRENRYPAGGGGVANSGTFTMNGGSITDNKARHGGGVENDGTFTMTGGSITQNYAGLRGGGVNNWGTFTMTGGSITGNKNSGIYNNDSEYNNYGSTVKLSGNVNITGNVRGGTLKNGVYIGGTSSNVYLPNGKPVTVESGKPLAATAKVGITAENPASYPTVVTGTMSTTGFFSDNANYQLIDNGSNGLLLAEVITFSGVKLLNETGGEEMTGGKTYDGKAVAYDDSGVSYTPTVLGVSLTYTWQKLNGETYSDLTAAPKAAGSYRLLVSAVKNGYTLGTQELAFTISPKEQTAPAKPELDSRTKNSITLKAIPDNANGAKAQYRMNDGEWQDSPVFTGLSSGTEYSFTARYAETDNYNASPASEAAMFRTDSSGGYNPPVYYTLTFETNGGDKLSPVSGSYNALIDLSKYTPTRSGYAFTGWYSDKGLTEKITSIRLNGSKTVYAGWQAEQNPNTGANPFTDVNTTDWFYNDVMFVYEKGLMLGTSKTTFSPYGTATRGMMATILWRMEGSPAPKGGNGFADVDAGKWYADAITWTAENGIFRGYDNNLFMPEDPITREQLAAIFYRYADYKGYDTSVKGNLSKFKDADKISGYAETAMQWAVGSGLIKGRDNGTLDPQGTATRAEIAAMLHRFIEKYDLVQGTTSGGMTGWISRNRLQIPQTGDSSALGLWGFTLCASLAAFLALGTRQLRRREEEAALQIIEK